VKREVGELIRTWEDRGVGVEVGRLLFESGLLVMRVP